MRYAIIRKPTIIQIIQYLTKLVQKNEPWISDVKEVIYIAVYETLRGKPPYNVSTLKPASKDLYHILVTFFLLAYEPKYSYNDILSIINHKNYYRETWKMNLVYLIGAFMGLNEIVEQNGEIANDLIRFTNRIALVDKLP